LPLPTVRKYPNEDGDGEYCVLILMQPSHFKMLLTTAFFDEIAIPLHGIAQSHIVNKVNRCTPPPLSTREYRKEDSDGEHCFLILMQPHTVY